MLNKNIKFMFLFLTLIILLIGVVSAQEVSSDSSTDDIVQEKTTVNSMVKENKNINKKDYSDNIKTGSPSNSSTNTVTTNKPYTTTAQTYKELVSKVNLAKKSNYTTYTINLKKGTYDATQKLAWNKTNTDTKLVINGNASIINGLNKYQFLNVGEDCTVNLKDITLKNFNENYGGAIYNEGILTITGSIFINNTANNEGGAIYSSGDLNVTKSIFNYNTAGSDGGAIYLYKTENDIINKNSFTGNTAGSDGGAITIYDSFDTIIENNNFTKNTAKDGGAIANIPRTESYTYMGQESYLVPESYLEQYWNPTKNYGIIGYTTTYNYNPMGYSTPIQIPQYGYTGGYDYRTATRYVTKYRTVSKTGYHYYGSDTIIRNNNFIENKATDEAAAILVSNGDVNITKNMFQRNKDNVTTELIKNNEKNIIKNVYKYNKNPNPIVDNGNTNIISNTFDDRKQSILSVNKISSVFYGQNLTISGKLLNNKNPIKNQNLTISYDGKKYTTTTVSSGYFKKVVAAKKVGTNNLVISYKGNDNYIPAEYKSSVNVAKSATKLTLTKITQKTLNDPLKITGKFTNALGKPFKNINVKIQLNDNKYSAKTNNNGVYSLTVKATKVGSNKLTVSHMGGKNYKAATAKTTFKTVPRATKITVNKIASTTKGKTVKITGKFTDNRGNPFKKVNVKISVYGKVIYAKTNAAGVYSYDYKTTNKGKFTVTVSFGGNTKYKATSTKTTLTVS